MPCTADDDASKKAFHALARKFHPDVCDEPNAEERFREIATAYGGPVEVAIEGPLRLP